MVLDANSEFLTIIPARGGSKGVPGKNMRALGSIPLIGWSIRQIIESTTPSRIAVTTDDADLASYAESLGVEIVLRPLELASDTATSESALVHALSVISKQDQIKHIIFLQATSPVRLSGTLDRAVRQYLDTKVDSLVGVIKSSPFLWRIVDGLPVALYDTNDRPRRQDFQPSKSPLRETGSLYITKRSNLLKYGNRISGKIGLFEMAKIEGLDIDTMADFRIAEILIEEGFHDLDH